MKHLFLALAAICALAAPVVAQPVGSPQNITVVDSGTACVTAPTACATFALDSSTGSVTLSVSGTWTGTLTFEGTNNNGVWTSLGLATNLATGAQGATTTANGLFTITNAGVILVRARATAAITGTAIITAAKGLGFARSNALTAPETITASGIAVTSTDGEILTNPTLATSGVPVQMSPRLKWCGTAYNSTSTLSETDCMFAEVLPATVAGTTTQMWKLGSTINGAAVVYPFTVSSAGNGVFIGGLTTGTVNGGNVTIQDASGIVTPTRTKLAWPADGELTLTNNVASIGSMFKADALPTVSACGAGSPAVVAGSTPLSGSVTIGTTAVATCTITFNGTAFPSAPQCTGSVQTTTAANVRAMGYSATTTVLTIVPASAWVDSSVVNWHCFSSK